MWLLDAYEHPNVNVSQRALVGAMIISTFTEADLLSIRN